MAVEDGSEVAGMTDRIGCKDCDSPYCQGCNMYTLWRALMQGRFDGLMGDNHAIHITADIAEVVRCKDCVYHSSDSDECLDEMGYARAWHKNDYCSYGRKEDEE